MKNLIPLQAAYIRQSRDVSDNRWVVLDENNNTIGELADSSLSPKEAMSYLHFARPFELHAWNEGIQFGKTEARKGYEFALENRDLQIEALCEENSRLARQLERFIIEGLS